MIQLATIATNLLLHNKKKIIYNWLLSTPGQSDVKIYELPCPNY